MTNYNTKTLKVYKMYDLRPLNVSSAPITAEEYNTAIETTEDILGNTAE